MAISKKLETIYHNGQPDGIRSIRRNLSTMTVYVIPRPLLSEAKNISGINRPGIYYLINESDDNKIAQIYVGQTRNGIARSSTCYIKTFLSVSFVSCMGVYEKYWYHLLVALQIKF